MSKPRNSSGTAQVTLSLSDESVRILRELALLGIYGKNEAEVAGRFVDKALEDFVESPRFRLPLRKQNKRAFAPTEISKPKGAPIGSLRQNKHTGKR